MTHSDRSTKRFLVLSQPSAPGSARAPWGDASRPTTATYLQASTLAEAALLAQAGGLLPEGHTPVGVEEASPGLVFDADTITAALTSVPEHEVSPLMEREDYEEGDDPLYGGGNFIHTVQEVASALQRSGLVPGLSVSMVYTDGYTDYAMVEMSVHGNTYRSAGSELKHLTEDRSASGWPAIIAIASALLGIASEIA